jgi:hypothetical protein
VIAARGIGKRQGLFWQWDLAKGMLDEFYAQEVEKWEESGGSVDGMLIWRSMEASERGP